MFKLSKRNWIIIITITLLAFLAVAYPLINKGKTIAVTTAKAETTDATVTVSASATISSSTDIALNFTGSGKLEELYAKEGDLVAPGQELARLDDTYLKSQLKQARSSLRIARANLSKLRAGATARETAALQIAADSAAVSLEAANRKLAEVQNKAAQDAAAAQVSVDEAKASRDFALGVRVAAADDYLDLVEKYKHPVYGIPNYTAAQETEVDTAKAAADTAMTAYLAAETAYKSALENKKAVDLNNQTVIQATQDAVNLADSQHQTALAQLNLKTGPPRSQDLQVAREQVVQATAAVEIAEKGLGDATLKSPVRGKVVSISADEGEFVIGGGASFGSTPPFMTVANLNQMQAVAEVDEVDISKVEIGQAVEASVDAYPETTIKGRVIEIKDRFKRTESGGIAFEVKVDLEVPESVKLKVGMNADVDIVVSVKKGALSVPQKAVVEKDGKDVVFVLENDTARLRQVKVGLTTDGSFEILSGLKESETVAVESAGKLEDGDRVNFK